MTRGPVEIPELGGMASCTPHHDYKQGENPPPHPPQRPPLVSDELIAMHMHRAETDTDLCDRIRQEYEDLITSGKLRVVKDAGLSHQTAPEDNNPHVVDVAPLLRGDVKALRIPVFITKPGLRIEVHEAELRVVKWVRLNKDGDCMHCGMDADHIYPFSPHCPGCGNPIKR